MINFVINFPLKLNTRFLPLKKSNGKNKIQPAYVSNPIYNGIATKAEIELAAQMNPKIKTILSENNISLEVNFNELEKLMQGHMQQTYIVVTKVYHSLPENMKQKIDLSALQEAALLHDWGKTLIPDKILNKKGRLEPDERKIMELHGELGYELLKEKGLKKRTLELIKYHHQDKNNNGYPKVTSSFEFDVDAQILSIADKYSALREKRSYKSPLAKYEALEIIAKEVNNGNISQEVYTALVRSV